MSANKAIKVFGDFLATSKRPEPSDLSEQIANVVEAITEDIAHTPRERAEIVYNNLITKLKYINYPQLDKVFIDGIANRINKAIAQSEEKKGCKLPDEKKAIFALWATAKEISNILQLVQEQFGNDLSDEQKEDLAQVTLKMLATTTGHREQPMQWQAEAIEKAIQWVNVSLRDIGLTFHLTEQKEFVNVWDNGKTFLLPQQQGEPLPPPQEPQQTANADAIQLPHCLRVTNEQEERTRNIFEAATAANLMERTPDGYKWTKGPALLDYLIGRMLGDTIIQDERQGRPYWERNPKLWSIFPQQELSKYFYNNTKRVGKKWQDKNDTKRVPKEYWIIEEILEKATNGN